MTFQVPDYVSIGRTKYDPLQPDGMPTIEIMGEYRWLWPPLHTLPEFIRRRLPPLSGESTALHRGYICHWLILGDRLSLLKIQRQVYTGTYWKLGETRHVDCPLEPVFGDMIEDCHGTKIMPWCDWFTGTMELLPVSEFADYLSNWRSRPGGTKTRWCRGQRQSSKVKVVEEIFS